MPELEPEEHDWEPLPFVGVWKCRKCMCLRQTNRMPAPRDPVLHVFDDRTMHLNCLEAVALKIMES